jgi:uncharacterized protein YbcI
MAGDAQPEVGVGTRTRGDRDIPIVASISRDIVGIYARFFGRGPTKARTIWREEVVVCLLEDIFTRSEEMLVKSGDFEKVRAYRQSFQDEVEPLLRATVEANTGRSVQSFFSQTEEKGGAVEVFVLDGPVGSEPD